MSGLFVLVLLVGIGVGYWFVTRPTKPKFLLHLEYWVYLPTETMPPQDEVMTRLVRPEKGLASVSGAEALLFSDVRLHIALVLRAKNSHVFRPDLLEPRVDATAEELVLLQEAQSLVKVRFVSEEPVLDRRYLKLLPQAARVIAEIGGGSLVYDTIGERLLDPEALRDGDPGPNVRWVAAPYDGHVETLGLKKLGLPEIRTAPLPSDERWIATDVVEQVALEVWKTGEFPPVAEALAFEDRFRVDLAVGKDGVALARVHRIQPL